METPLDRSASATIDRHLVADPALDWTTFDDRVRAAFVEELDRAALMKSSTLQRVVDLAAALAGSEYAQISLISDVQYVPVAHGLELSDSAQGTPMSDSLCSVTMAAGRSVIIHDAPAHPWVRDLPPVTSGVVGSYLGVPLRRTDGQLLGALCVFDGASATWSDHVARALEDLVTFAVKEIELVATVQAQSLSVRQLTTVIHRIIAAPTVAVPAGIEITGRHRSNDVGGDWYEWTSLDGDVAITIGDVAGHGLSAVATMARLKAHVRAYVVEGHDPGETLRRVDHALAIEQSDEMATVFDARYRPADGTFTYASAGHPPPLVLRSGAGFFADLRPGPPIGFGVTAVQTHRLLLERGDTVVMCTDGLYEQRGSTLDESLEALRCRAVSAISATTSLADFADTLLQCDLSDTDDDACLVAFRV